MLNGQVGRASCKADEYERAASALARASMASVHFSFAHFGAAV